MYYQRWESPHGFSQITTSLLSAIRPRYRQGIWVETILEQPLKKTKKICDEILTRFGDGEYLRHICTGKDEYPDQATFWRWRQKDRDLAEQFMGVIDQECISPSGEVGTVDRRSSNERSNPEGGQDAEPLSMEGREADTIDAVDQ